MVRESEIRESLMRLLILLGLGAQLLIACNFTELQANTRDAGAIDLDAARASLPAPTALPDEIVNAADAEYRLLSNIYERASPSVVNIEALSLGDDGSASDTRRGSGFVYDQQGHIITNAHLVSTVDSITVTLQSAQVYSAQVLALDSFSDLAVLKIAAEPERLAPLRIGESAPVRVGQRGIVIGNPFGLSSSMTTGVISGLGRTLPSVELAGGGIAPGFDNPSIIQIDAIINPGNSGGPLLDSRGLVIGITTAIRSDNGLFQGIGFAVPADTMRRVIPDLIKQGRVDYAWMGISVMREDGGFGVAGLSAALDLSVERGVLLRGVTEGSPAYRAGLRGGDTIVDVRGEPVCAGGDLIVAINGYHFRNLDDLVTYLVQQTRPDDEVELLVIRDRLTLEIPVTLASRALESGRTLDCHQPQ